MQKVADTFSEEEKPAMLEALQSWRFPYWDWAAKKPQPGGAADDYDLPVVVPFKGVEIKVPESFKAASAQPPAFAEGDVWSDPSVPEPGEHRQALENPLYNFTMPKGYENMGDQKLGKLAIISSAVLDQKTGIEYHYPVSISTPPDHFRSRRILTALVAPSWIAAKARRGTPSWGPRPTSKRIGLAAPKKIRSSGSIFGTRT
jgi:hypothetical protein